MQVSGMKISFSDKVYDVTPEQEEKIKAILEVEFPQSLETYWTVTADGGVCLALNDGHQVDEQRLATGNCFRTRAEVERHKQRMLSRKPGFLPKKGEKYWSVGVGDGPEGSPEWSIWDGVLEEMILYWNGLTFKTKEDCQAWIDEYKDAYKI